MAGVKFVHVPYKGGAPALIDLVAGQVQLFWSSTPQVASLLKAGRLRIIAAGTQKPSRIAPEYAPVADDVSRIRLQYLVRDCSRPRGRRRRS